MNGLRIEVRFGPNEKPNGLQLRDARLHLGRFAAALGLGKIEEDLEDDGDEVVLTYYTGDQPNGS